MQFATLEKISPSILPFIVITNIFNYLLCICWLLESPSILAKKFISVSAIIVYLSITKWVINILHSKYRFNYVENKNFRLAFNLFIISEALIFISLFWSWSYNAVAPSIELGTSFPPVGINEPMWWGIALLNSLVLFLSSIFFF